MINTKPACILSVNGGSSSIKFSLHLDDSLELLMSGALDFTVIKNSRLQIKFKEDNIFKDERTQFDDLTGSIEAIISWLKDNQQHFSVAAIGHRVVQGGPSHREPTLITDDLIESLHQYEYLSPNHLPREISIIKALQVAFPGIPQVVCFDNCFHKDMPAVAKYYPLPGKYRAAGMLRYGFHGLSYEYIMKKLGERKQVVFEEKIIIAHLGNGASMTAIKNNVAIDTTMGMSPIGGLMMGTRSGDLDPGVLLFLLKQEKMPVDDLDELLNKQSGLKAIGGTSDIRELLENEAAGNAAHEALALFCYQAKKFLGALAASMGGLDTLVFTGGIGANSAVIRERICEGLGYMGITIDEPANFGNDEIISSDTNWVKVYVMQTDEELMIATHTQQIIKNKRT